MPLAAKASLVIIGGISTSLFIFAGVVRADRP